MQAIIAPQFTAPAGYELATVDRPAVRAPTDVLVRVHAASVNPVDVKLASGAFKFALAEKFPLRIGYDCAGVVAEIGADVTRVKVGDHVWSRLPEVSKGSWAEYITCAEDHIALKPASLSFADAAALPLAALTSLQALEKYRGSLTGKTVFVPGGLSGTGAFACQLAKNVFGAGKVITTVSTAKVPQVPQYLGEHVVDQIIDYTKEDPLRAIPAGSVDFLLDTMGDAMAFLSLMTPGTSTIVSISTLPSGTQLQNASFFRRPDKPTVPMVARLGLDAMDYVRKLRARRRGVDYTYMFLESNAADLDRLREIVEAQKLRPVVGSRAPLQDIDKVRAVCTQVYNGKGGLGKAVFVVVEDEQT